MATTLGLILVTAGCRSPQKPAISEAAPPVVVSGRTPVAFYSALTQLTSESRKVASTVAKPVSTIGEGLPQVQKVSPRPILALAEQEDWFFYATATATDQTTHQPVSFIAGYAIKKGGREIIQWSVW